MRKLARRLSYTSLSALHHAASLHDLFWLLPPLSPATMSPLCSQIRSHPSDRIHTLPSLRRAPSYSSALSFPFPSPLLCDSPAPSPRPPLVTTVSRASTDVSLPHPATVKYQLSRKRRTLTWRRSFFALQFSICVALSAASLNLSGAAFS